ncbi:hypothetical protein J2S21_002010 [Peribacillus cavernae]|nr:hypothetical protein [Peribacillus cavernae]
MYEKDSKKRLKNLELNMGPFKKIGGEYLFSAVPIDNAAENDLKLDKIFTEKSAAWKIYLYKLM